MEVRVVGVHLFIHNSEHPIPSPNNTHIHTDRHKHRHTQTHTHTHTQSYLGDWEIKNDSSKDNFLGN